MLERLDRAQVEVEQPVQRLGVGVAVGLGGKLLDAHRRRVQQLVDDPAHELLDVGAVRRPTDRAA